MCSLDCWAPSSYLTVLPGNLIVEATGFYMGPAFVVHWKTPGHSAEVVINDAVVYEGPHQGLCIGFLGCIIYVCAALHFSDIQGVCAIVVLRDYES